MDDRMAFDQAVARPQQERQAPTQTRPPPSASGFLCFPNTRFVLMASLTGNPVTHAREVEDIVTAHRQRNRAPRLPSSSQLLAAKQRQTSSSRTQVGNEHPETSSTTQVAATPQRNPITAPTTNEEHGVNDTSNLRPIGPATEGAEPWQMQYYDPSTRDIIERAKQFSHCDAASISAFPLRPAFNGQSCRVHRGSNCRTSTPQLHISEGKSGWCDSCPNSTDRFMQVGGRNILRALPDW